MQRKGYVSSLISGMAMAVAVAAPAVAGPVAADQDAYLRPLLVSYSFLTSEQLLTEASRVCNTINTGNAASVAIAVVQQDLEVSVPAALDIVRGAIKYLGC